MFLSVFENQIFHLYLLSIEIQFITKSFSHEIH